MQKLALEVPLTEALLNGFPLGIAVFLALKGLECPHLLCGNLGGTTEYLSLRPLIDLRDGAFLFAPSSQY